MKESELLASVKAGQLLLVGTFVHFKKEVVPYRDRKTGQPATFDKVEFQVLTANGVVSVQPDTRKIPGFKMDSYRCPFKPQQPVVVIVEGMVTERGNTTIAGSISALEA